MTSTLGYARRGLNSLLNRVGFELGRVDHRHNWDDYGTFIPFHDTLNKAAAAGLSVSDYIEKRHNRSGATEETLEGMAAAGVFEADVEAVCEIGPGSGRYLFRTQERCHPKHYEIYETATDWAQWLETAYGVKVRPTDGRTLSATPDQSIDLIQAHKVFTGTPTLASISYMREMARVVRSGGSAVFDILTEGCLDPETVDAWLGFYSKLRIYPAIMPKQFVIDVLQERGLSFQDSFFVDMRPGRTECMIFKK